MNVSLDQLLVLDAIERLGSFSAAAKELYRATSAVSYAIKTLESSLDIEIYDRSGHKAVLTEGGRLILEEGRAVLERARQLENVANHFNAGWEPRLIVVMDGVLPMRPPIKALRRFTAQDLPTKVELRVDYLAMVRERFDKLEAALMITVDLPSEPMLEVRALQPLEMLLVAHAEHPLHDEAAPLRRSAFASHVQVLVTPSAGKGMKHIRKMYFDVPHVFELSDFRSKREALVGGVGFGWMPTHMIQEELDEGILKTLPFEEGHTFLFTPQLVTRRDKPLGSGGRLFAEYIEEEWAQFANKGKNKKKQSKSSA